MLSTSIFVLIVSATFSTFLLWWVIPLLRHRLLDQPNVRSCHQKPTPRGGGFVFVLLAALASVFAAATSSGVVVLISLPLAVVGLLDDRFNLPSGLRYSVQLCTAFVLSVVSPLVFGLTSAFGLFLWLPVLVVVVIAITAFINFTNFMDGLDGLVAACMLVVLGSAAIQFSLPWPIWALEGGMLGFLFWNWSPAKVFMGDVGSTFLGATFAGLLLQSPSWMDAFAFLLVATPLLGDACLCVLRRLFAGHSVLQAHRLHLFQRLHQAGWSHQRVTVLYVASTAVLALTWLSSELSSLVLVAALIVGLGVVLDQHKAVPFAVAARR